ncbi:hypothetical protein SAY87_012140 [Trapa incisa]|uniref:Uncharacterized protein n=1 Tax=Trapa incisa TaxID=236973 RepID=A0AAN7GJJ9_9MYRT|nr:hypothetical protein SAY87_012140 [Trapa incisa]
MAEDGGLRSVRGPALSNHEGDKLGGLNPSIVGVQVVEVVQQDIEWALPVTMAWTKNPYIENMVSLPFLICLTLISMKVTGSLARPTGSQKYRPPPGRPLIRKAHDDDLEPYHGQCALSMDEVGVGKVVKAALVEDLSPNLQLHWLLEVDPGRDSLLEYLRSDTSQSPEHGSPTVDNLEEPIVGKRPQGRQCPSRSRPGNSPVKQEGV